MYECIIMYKKREETEVTSLFDFRFISCRALTV